MVILIFLILGFPDLSGEWGYLHATQVGQFVYFTGHKIGYGKIEGKKLTVCWTYQEGGSQVFSIYTINGNTLDGWGVWLNDPQFKWHVNAQGELDGDTFPDNLERTVPGK